MKNKLNFISTIKIYIIVFLVSLFALSFLNIFGFTNKPYTINTSPIINNIVINNKDSVLQTKEIISGNSKYYIVFEKKSNKYLVYRNYKNYLGYLDLENLDDINSIDEKNILQYLKN